MCNVVDEHDGILELKQGNSEIYVAANYVMLLLN